MWQYPLLPHLNRRMAVVLCLCIITLFLSFNPSFSAPVAAQENFGTLTGTVYRDFDNDGVRDTREPGIANITVNAVDQFGVTASATSGANGSYSLPGLNGYTRVEYTVPTSLSFLQPAAAGNTSVQFVYIGASATVTLNTGFFNPSDFTGANPRLATALFRRADNTGVTDSTIEDYLVSAAGTFGTVTTHEVTDGNTTGTVYGLAYQRATNRLYSGAYIRRGASLGSTDNTGAIYRTTTPTGTPSTALLINLNTVAGINTGTNPHPKGVAGFNWNVDANAYAAVGKIGLGDLEISDDDTTLYAVNLNQRSVVVIPFQSDLTTVNTGGITQVTVPADATNCGATVGVMRPFGLKFHDGSLYVGVVCTAETNNTRTSLRAYIFQFNPTTNTFVTPAVLSFTLDYTRRHVNDSFGTTSATSTTDGEWRPWSDTWRPSGCYGCPDDLWAWPQPMLTDIEFDGEGFMMIGLRDRLADQAFHQDDPGPSNGTLRDTRNGGDLLLACLVSGTWTLENAGTCNGRTTTDTLSDNGEANRGSGPGQREFYWEDQYQLDYDPDYHRDTEMGSLAVVKGTGEIVTTFYDVFDTFETGTVIMDNDNGERISGVQLIAPDSVFGKSGGIGDVELLAARAPVEIGNRVWRDTDGDGIQDPNEAALAGVTVQLRRGGTTISTVITDLNGNYIFSSDTSRTDRLGADYGISLTYGEALTIRIDPTAGQNGNALSGMVLTAANADATTNGDLRDSDATLNGSNAEIAITLGGAGQNNHTYDIGYAPLGSIGNRVWLDEDSNGYQDEGEAGIANVTVQLKNSGGTVIATTVTDSNGYYIFKNLPAGTYFVQVLGSSVPTGLSQTTIYPSAGADESNQNQSTGNGYQVVLPGGGVNLTADFGYNWNPTADVNNGTNNAAIGDCVWYDADGDGAQDPEESGISGVTVQLITPGPDNLFFTSDDVVASTTTTSNTGCYLFDDLTPGAYVVRIPTTPANTTQTGDPDHWGTTGPNDNQTTVPVVLAPGDVFLDADFGYQLTAGNFGSIGDTVWLDIDADDIGPANAPTGTDTTEAYIPNVSVALIRDLDNDGVWDAGEPIIASDVTDGNGFYLFPGLPIADGTGTDDYLVVVTDAFNALHGLIQTFDHDGSQTDGMSRAQDLGTTAVLTEDFGYVYDNSGTNGAANTTLPIGTGAEATGRLGDRVWLDIDDGDDQDANEPGIPNVEVILNCRGLDDTSGTADDLVLTTLTGDNGYYLFDNIPVDAGGNQCVVSVNTGTLPGGLTQTYDATNPQTDSSSTVTLTSGTPTNFVQDFGYRGTGTIGNLVWRDTNADGDNDGVNGPDGTAGTDDDEPGIVGVTLTLWYDRNGNGIIDGVDIPLGSQTTTAGGAYLFSGLPVDDGGGNAQYIVDVTDTAGLLNGYWHSLGTAATNNNSQNDPYAVTLTTGAPNNLTADFGYYVRGAAIGNRVWRDTDSDGIQDAGEPSLPGVIVRLAITYPNGAGSTTLYAATNSVGYYSFGNLLLDEDHNGVVAPEPLFTVSVNNSQPALAGLAPTLIDQGGNDLQDSDNHVGVAAFPIEGRVTVPVVVTVPTSENSIASYDFGYVITGAIGNKVWIDEDSNGVQDEGEDGIPNVTVNLYNSAGTVIAVTTTNIYGEYLFTNLPAATYFVRVDGTTIPAGMSQTTIYPSAGNDLVNQDQSTGTNDYGYQITLGAGQVNLTADFGYNWNPTGDVNTPGAATTAALGDHVWVDSDGDGAQDPEEVGIPGVTLQIVTAGPDNVFGTGDDVLGATTITNATGYYIFDGLTPGAYVVQVVNLPVPYNSFTQTGDPDHFGTTGVNDGRTTAPVILGPGDVFLNADFGYQPSAGVTGSIGDTIWLDLDADSVGPANAPGGTDTNEPYIAGVTVSLIRDLNQNGIRNTGEPIIATDVTDSNGFYLFTGLQITDGTGTDDYIVVVDDTANRLRGLTQTYDENGIATPNVSAVANLTATAVLTQDFGYTYDNSGTGGSSTTTQVLPGVTATLGRIGDRVWLDLDSDDVQDANEPGLVGVTVTLTSNGPDGTGGTADDISLSTVTGANGTYLFPNLPVTAGGVAYTIQVVTTSLPGSAGLSQTYDASGSQTDSTSTVTLTTAAPVNLNQDFGYVGTGTVGNLVWNDVNGDGNVDGGENGFANVTLAIYWDSNNNGQLDPNDRLINTTTTDSAGAYLFTGLSVNDGTGNNIQYIVDVTDQNGVLAGYHHTIGLVSTNDNSQDDDGYMVLLSTGTTSNLTADFGYEQQPAAVGNRVWSDDNANGLQDSGELGISGVVVNLTITYPGGGSITVSTITNNDGYYSFANLLLDEDYNGDGVAPEPTFTISLNPAQAVLSGYSVTLLNQGANDLIDSDDPAGVVAQATEGLSTIPTTPTDPAIEPVRASYDFGFVSTLDYGDLPTTYSNIRLTNNGARHVIGAVRLGTLVDADGDGAPTANATGDDTLDGTDDEDGAIKTPGSMWTAGGTGRLNITVSGGTGCVAAWIDWNRDNDFADTGERIFVDQSITNATQTVTFPIPGTATFPAGQVLNLRVRLYSTCTGGAASPVGLASGIGEVEDHQLDSAPLAVVMESFEAQCRPTDILAAWATASETDVLGFNLWRGTTEAAPDTQINSDLIPSQSPGGGQGAIYEFADTTVQNGNTYYYWLDAVDMNGTTTRFGPVSSEFPCAPTAVTVATVQVAPATTPHDVLGMAALALVAVGALGGLLRRRR